MGDDEELNSEGIGNENGEKLFGKISGKVTSGGMAVCCETEVS